MLGKAYLEAEMRFDMSYLMLGRLDPEEGEAVGGVQVPHHRLGPVRQLGHHPPILKILIRVFQFYLTSPRLQDRLHMT
jgi:hypothetical protein